MGTGFWKLILKKEKNFTLSGNTGFTKNLAISDKNPGLIS